MDETTQVFEDLLVLIRTLRGEGGCPWDRKQTIQSLKVYLEQEFKELLEVLEKDAAEKIQEEMGDLIFLLLFTAEIARDRGDFSIGDVLEGVKKKMIRRHPHVFGDLKTDDISQIKKNWKEIKAREKLRSPGESLAETMPRHLPLLLQVQWTVRKAAETGLRWPNPLEVLDRLDQETAMIGGSLGNNSRTVARYELGELFFAFIDLCRSSNVNPEELVREFVSRFIARCQYVERSVQSQNRSVREASAEALACLWQKAKEEERKGVVLNNQNAAVESEHGGKSSPS